MTAELDPVLQGAVAMASFVVTLFFLRFWRQTRDRFFLWFAAGFAIDVLTRLALGFVHPSDESEPLFYLARLLMFGLIIIAIIEKNRPSKKA